MKLKSAIAAGVVALALGSWTSSVEAQRTSATPSTGSSQAGSGRGVNTDPGTQGTTDRAGQTPKVDTGKTGQPSGSIGGDNNASGKTIPGRAKVTDGSNQQSDRAAADGRSTTSKAKTSKRQQTANKQKKADSAQSADAVKQSGDATKQDGGTANSTDTRSPH